MKFFTLCMLFLSTIFAPTPHLFLSRRSFETNAEFIQPNTSTFLYGGEYYDIQWNLSNNVNLQFQIYNDSQDSWVSHINSNHFLSIVIDQTTNNYNWSVPLYLSQYWQNPSRMVLNSLDTSLSVISDEFNIAGIYVNMSFSETSNNIVFMNDNISITWETNTNSTLFNVSVYDNTTNYNNIKYRQPLYPICSNIRTNDTSLCEWNNVNQTGSFVIGVTSNRLYGLSSHFNVFHTPTSAPTHMPTILTTTYSPTNIPTTKKPTSTKNNDNGNDNDKDKERLWIIISIVLATCIVMTCIIIYLIINQNQNNRNIQPDLNLNRNNTIGMYRNEMYRTASTMTIPTYISYSQGFNNVNHYEVTPSPSNSNNSLQSPPIPSNVYVMQEQNQINQTNQTNQTNQINQTNLYPNIDDLETNEYSMTQFEPGVRARKNNSYEKMAPEEHIYNKVNIKYNYHDNDVIETFEC